MSDIYDVPAENVLLVPAYRSPYRLPGKEMWFAAIGASRANTRCDMGKALVPDGPDRSVNNWDGRFVWSLIRRPGGVAFFNRWAMAVLRFTGQDERLDAEQGNADTPHEIWDLAPVDKYPLPGFAVRPSPDKNQNLNILGGSDGGHQDMIGAAVGTWHWHDADQNEVWAIVRIDTMRPAVRLDEQGWPLYE